MLNDGSRQSKSYGLGTGWISPEHTSRCRWRRFPFQHSGAASPSALPDCHLVRTAILFLPGKDSLGDFHHSPTASLASFAKRVSPGNHSAALAGAAPRGSLIHPPHVKAGYVRAQRYGPERPMHRITGSQSVSYAGRKYHDGSTSAHKNRSPRKQGRVDHAIAHRPESASARTRFPPAPTQDWASQAGTTGFIAMPFRGFLGPP